MLPPIPTWEGLHPVIIHFPIALFIVAPILILLGAFMPNKGRPFLIAAFILMVIGAVATFVAVSTGEAAGELAEKITNAKAVLENHEELGEQTRTIFTALTVVFGMIVFVPMLFKKELGSKFMIPVYLVFLLFYGAGTVVLLNTAHEGGRLVHEFGVRATMAGNTGNNPNTTETKPAENGDDDDK